MVRNPEKKMTRKIRKNRQTRKRNLRRIRTKMWRNRTYKTMKGGESWRLVNLRIELRPSQSQSESQPNIGRRLNNIMINLKKKFLDFSPFTPVQTPNSSRPDKYGVEFMTQLNTVSNWFNSKNDSFIPETYDRNLDDNFVIAFMKIYDRYYDFTTKDVLLTRERFEAILRNVLTGKIHLSVVGASVRFVYDDEYKNLIRSLDYLLRYLNGSLSLYGLAIAQHKISQEQSSSSPVSKQQTTKDYELTAAVPPSLQNFCQTLDTMFSISTPTAVVRMCCFITMPNAVYIGDQNKRRFVEGYDSESFDTVLRQWKWFPTQNLARNTYFETRKELRKIYQKNNQPNKDPQLHNRRLVVLDERNVTLLTYTMSPYISNQEKDETYSLNIRTQIRHEDLLSSMDQIIKKANDSFKKTMVDKKQKFDTTGSIVFVRKATTTNLMTYYELKISKQQIRSNDVIVCSLKAISEDGICGSEAIFVTYSPPSTGTTTPLLPGQTELEDINFTDDVDKVDKFKQEIIDQIFIPERLRLERALTTDVAKYIDKIDVDLDSELESGFVTRVSRNPQSFAGSLNSVGPIILDRDEEYDGICTLVLRFDENFNASWAVAEATPIQSAAFQAVNKYITDKSKSWTPNSIKLFHVSNNAEGNANITVSIEVKRLDKSNSLLFVEYQAKASSPYELYQTRAAADEAILDKKLNYFWTDQV